MIQRLKQFMTKITATDPDQQSGHSDEELHIAAAAMLIEAAMMDGDIDERERLRIATLIEQHFGIPREEVSQIVHQGEERQEAAVDIYSFLRVVNGHFGHEERVHLVEMLWDVAYVDGELHDHEANLVRRVAGMLGIEDRESGAARKRVLAQYENQGESSDSVVPEPASFNTKG